MSEPVIPVGTGVSEDLPTYPSNETPFEREPEEQPEPVSQPDSEAAPAAEPEPEESASPQA